MKTTVEDLMGCWHSGGDGYDSPSVHFEFMNIDGQVRYDFKFYLNHNHGYEYLDFSGERYAIEGNNLILYPSSAREQAWEDYMKIETDETTTNSVFRIKIEGRRSAVQLRYSGDYVLKLEA